MTASTNTAQTTDSGRAAIRKLALNTFLGEGVVAACIDLAKSLVDGFDLDPLFIRDTQACLDPTDLDDPCCHPERLFFECCAPRSFIRSISVPRTFVADTTLSDTCVRASGDVDAVQRAVRQVLAKFQASFEHGVCDAQSAVTECTEPSLLSVVDVCEAQVYGSDGRGPRCLYVPSCVRCCSVFPVLFITPLPSPPPPFCAQVPRRLRRRAVLLRDGPLLDPAAASVAPVLQLRRGKHQRRAVGTHAVFAWRRRPHAAVGSV